MALVVKIDSFYEGEAMTSSQAKAIFVWGTALSALIFLALTNKISIQASFPVVLLSKWFQVNRSL